MTPFVLVGAGGILGVNARYLVANWAADRWGSAFPYGTLLINVSGSFAMGLLLALVAARFDNNQDARLLIGTGFLGAYTTFSTFAFETIALGRQRDHIPALMNALGSVTLGIAAAGAGYALGTLLGG